MERRNELLFRVYLIFFAFVLFAMIIIAKVVKTALIEGDKWRAQGGKHVKLIDVEGERGNIYCEHGNLLATSLPYFDIKLDLVPCDKDVYFKENISALSQKMSQHFGKSAGEWRSILERERRKKSRYYSLMNNVSKEELDLLNSFPLFNLGKYKGGLMSERKTRRERPFRQLASRTIGIDRLNEDKVGLERSFDKMLKGETEKRLMRRLPGDIWLPVLDPSEMNQERGSDIVTTLDMHIQDVAHSELENVLIENKAQKGVAIVMEVKTGAIKAMVNLRANGQGQYEERFNDGVGTLSEPGSTFKLISALVMLESGKVDLDTKVSMFGGKKKFYDQTMLDSEMHGTVSGTFREAFAMSSNVGVGYSAFKLFGKDLSGWTGFYEGMDRLGVTKETGIEIYGERKPVIKSPLKRTKNNPNNWSGTTVPWMAHGYELEMTPLQILNYYNAVANDGRLMKPYLVSEVVDNEGEKIKFKPKVLNESIASASTIMKAQELLKAVAESGTARKLKVDGLSFAGKTGTTRLEYWKKEDRKKYNASFAGYFPEENPQYSMIVVVYDPEGRDFYGAKVAGPVFRNVMKRLSGYEKSISPTEVDAKPNVLYAQSGSKSDYKKVLEFIGLGYEVQGKGSWVEMRPKEKKMALKQQSIKKNVVPDVRGKGLRDAMYILEEKGMNVEVDGMGRVYKQSQDPGKDLKEKKIKIYLK